MADTRRAATRVAPPLSKGAVDLSDAFPKRGARKRLNEGRHRVLCWIGVHSVWYIAPNECAKRHACLAERRRERFARNRGAETPQISCQLVEIESCAGPQPFRFDFRQTSQQELPEAPSIFDEAECRFGNFHPLIVDRPCFGRLHLGSETFAIVGVHVTPHGAPMGVGLRETAVGQGTCAARRTAIYTPRGSLTLFCFALRLFVSQHFAARTIMDVPLAVVHKARLVELLGLLV